MSLTISSCFQIVELFLCYEFTYYGKCVNTVCTHEILVNFAAQIPDICVQETFRSLCLCHTGDDYWDYYPGAV